MYKYVGRQPRHAKAQNKLPSLSMRLEEEGAREILGGSKKPRSEEEGETGKHARNVHRRVKSHTGT